MINKNIKNWLLGLLCVFFIVTSSDACAQIDWTHSRISDWVDQAVKANADSSYNRDKIYDGYHLVAIAQETSSGALFTLKIEVIMDESATVYLRYYKETVNGKYITAYTIDLEGLRRFYIMKEN